ncbi:MAG: PQQ-binding-like beta-propeller repeat protein [Planctomycetota bacterium]
MHVIEAGKTMVAHYIRCEQRAEAHETLEKLIQIFPDEISFAVSLVNLYYDQGQVERAAAECEKMASGFLKRKRVSPAVSLYKKLLVIDPERQDVRDKIRKIVSGKRKKPTRRGGSLVRVFVTIGVMLLLSSAAVVMFSQEGKHGDTASQLSPEMVGRILNGARDAYERAATHGRGAMRSYSRLRDAVSTDPLEASDEIGKVVEEARDQYRQFEDRALKVEKNLTELRDQPLDEKQKSSTRVMSMELRDLRGNVQAEQAKWSRRAIATAERLIEKGEDLYETQKLRAALDHFKLAKAIHPDPAKAAEAGLDDYIRNLEDDRNRVQDVLQKARDAESNGNLATARREYIGLIKEFGHADLLEGIRLPVELVTMPTGATIFLDGAQLPGKTPHVVRLDPFRVTQVRLERNTYQAEEFALGPFGDTTDPDKVVYDHPMKKKETWKRQVGDRLDADPGFSGKRVATVARNGEWAVLNLKDGRILRRGAIKGAHGFTTGPVAFERRFFLVSLDRKLHSIDPVTGKVGARNLELPEMVYAQPLLRDKRLYIADVGGNVICIDPLGGRMLWDKPAKTPHGVGEGLDLTAQGEDLVVVTLDGQVTVLRRKDGKQVIDTFRVDGSLACAPTPFGPDDLIFATEEGRVQVWGRVRATRIWEREFKASFTRSLPVSGRGVFVTPTPKDFYAIDARTEDIYFRTGSADQVSRDRVQSKDRIFAVHGRVLSAFAPTRQGYGRAWHFEAEGQILAGPVMHGGAVYIGDDKGYLYRLEANDE